LGGSITHNNAIALLTYLGHHVAIPIYLTNSPHEYLLSLDSFMSLLCDIPNSLDRGFYISEDFQQLNIAIAFSIFMANIVYKTCAI
jgi:hypothetical protein